jgi:NADPH:quinone reductase-like Zn-dependent oxidoreductase
MQAIVNNRYGAPDGLELQELEIPEVGDDQVLVRVQAASVNPIDWHRMRGQPLFLRASEGLTRPKNTGLGGDLAGRVEVVGRSVTSVRPGDEVFGMSIRTLAEYVRVSEDAVVPKPANATFAEAAAVPVAALTALQGLRDKGQVQPGQRVLINGAAGGVGTFAVQLANVLGARVTGVCGTRNVELVRSLGADDVVDYTREDFTRSGQRYDLIFDAVGNHSLSALKRVVEPEGTIVWVGAARGALGGKPMLHLVGALVRRRFVDLKVVPYLTKRSKDDLLLLKQLIESGQVTPVIDRSYPLSEVPEAIRYLEAGHARGKVVITLNGTG